MKKNKISLITLITSTALLIACSNNALTSNNSVSSSTLNSSNNESIVPSSQSNNDDVISVSSAPIISSSDDHNYGGDNSSTSEPISSSSSSEAPSSSAPSSSSSSDAGSSSSSNSGSTSSQPVDVNDDTLDGDIEKFLDDLNISIPSLNDYDLEHLVIYYYAYESYMIVAYGEDLDGSIESAYASRVNTESTLISQNDDDDYPVEYYGYIYSDEEQSIVLSFYTDDGLFYLSLTRYDGLYGSLDVSDVDTNWYVDYINFQGMELVNEIPLAEIKEYLGLDNLVLPAFVGNAFPVYFQEAYVNDDDEYVPDTFYVVLEGDQVENCVNLLKLAGFEAELVENTGYDIDWDNYELIEYTYYTGVAYDTDKNVYITISPDESENTLISFNNYEDLFCKSLTKNTDWTDDEKALMNETLHQVLPFMAFGEDYELYDDSDESWDVLVLEDSYSEDLSEDYVALLLEEGFVEYDDPDYGLLYKYDNGQAYIEIFVYYYIGNFLEIYFEESRLPALTALALNETSLDIVAGASFQLEPSYTPNDATHPLTWSSSNEEIATVNNKGLVTIEETAEVDTSVVITASTANGVSASCTFNIKANTVTGVKFAKDNYSVIPGGDKVQTSYYLLPYGATTNETVTYSVDPNNVDVHVDNDGKVYADNTAAEGSEVTLTINVGGVSTTTKVTVASATVTHTLTREFFGIEKANYSKYLDYKKITKDGATYEAACAGTNGIQIRSKNDPSGIIGHFDGRTCKSITFTFDSNTYDSRTIDIYASNSPFTIADMYGSSLTKVGSITYQSSDASSYTQTYTFTSDYSYIGFRSSDGAIYLTSVNIVW